MSDSQPNIASSSQALQRMSSLIGIPALLAEFGVDLDVVLDGLPIPREAFLDVEARVPFWAASRLLQNCAEATACQHFGLTLGSRHDHRVLGLAGVWMQNAATLGDALTGFVAMQPSASSGATIYLHRSDEAVVLGYGIYERNAVGREQAFGIFSAIAFNVARTLTLGSGLPQEVLLSMRVPAERRPYADFFGVPVRFDQPQTGLVFPRAAMSAPIAGANAANLEAIRRRAASLMPAPEHPWTDRVRRALRPLLLMGEPTAPTVSAQLGVNVRTLARYLAKERTSFQVVLDQVRFDAARELLSLTDLSVGDIAQALAYATHPAFGDAFRRWTGTSPTEWRRKVAANSR
jgi:AraC-like DNA-binding protein